MPGILLLEGKRLGWSNFEHLHQEKCHFEVGFLTVSELFEIPLVLSAPNLKQPMRR
jgi:hypothetical protein